MSQSAATPRAFLSALLNDCAGRIEIRAWPPGDGTPRTHFSPLADLSAALAFCRRLSKTHNLFVGIASRHETGGGTLQHCQDIAAAYIDIDFDTCPEPDARRLIAAFPLRPSCLVASGHGLHAYWFFRESLDVATDGPELKRLLARLAQHFHADPAVAELARVMRIPGSFNFKDQDEDEHAPPIKVGIEHIDAERRYNIADFDEILPTVAARPTPATAVPLSPGDPIRKGQRNIELHRVGRKLRAAGLSPAAIEAALRATPCQPPLPPAEIDALVKQVLTQKDRPDYQGGGGDDVILDADVKVPVVTQLSTVTALPIDWIWKGNLARGKKTLVAGNPGEGKTTITLDVTARVTTGRTMPDGTPGQLGNVLILTAEDDLADTVRPRVDQLDGEPRRVFALEAVRDAHGDRPLNLARDLDMLVEAMAQVKPVLVIIDPISAYLGRTDSYKDAEVRGLLAPLAAVLREHHAALIAIAHLTKDQQKAALHRPGGSVAFVAAARLVFAVGTDPSDETRQILAPLKTNICTKPPSLAYRIDEAGRITWDAEPVVGLDAEALLSVASSETRTELADADAFLREVLEDGPMKQSAVAKLARSQGFADRTLRRARERIGVETSKQGFSGDSFWIWSLPPIHTEVGHLRDETGKTPMNCEGARRRPPLPNLANFVATQAIFRHRRWPSLRTASTQK